VSTTLNGWLWSGLGVEEWLISQGAQTAFSFLVIGILLTPLGAWLKRLYREAIDPTTRGGAGDHIVAGRRVYRILADVKREHE
jgi:hypothetical protein